MPIALPLFLLGLIVGSFLNVVISRYGTGRGLAGRSACGSCGEKLSPADLVPLLSFLVLRGRCRSCGSRIALSYPAVEFATGALFAALALKGLDPLPFLAAAAAGSLLIVVFVYDLRHRIIPDQFVLLLALPALFVALSERGFVLGLLAGPAVALPLALLAGFSGGRLMGWGDAKLALPLGWLLGLSQGVAALIISFWAGAAIALSALAVERIRGRALFGGGKRLTMKSEVPFAPFLIAGAGAAFFLGIDATDLLGYF